MARGLMARGIDKGDRVGIWAPNCPEWTIVQYATAKIGAILVNVNPAYRTHELAYVLNQSGVRTLIAATAFKSSDYRSMVDEVRGRRLGCPTSSSSAPTTGSGCAPAPTPCADRTARPARRAGQHRPDQHPVHLGHNGFPEGCDAVAPQHPEQRLLRHRPDQPGSRRPAVHPGALLPLLRHGDGQPGLHDARRDDGDPGARFRSGRDAGGRSSRNGAPASTACRRCSSPCSAIPTSPSATCRRCAPGSWRARYARSR